MKKKDKKANTSKNKEGEQTKAMIEILMKRGIKNLATASKAKNMSLSPVCMKEQPSGLQTSKSRNRDQRLSFIRAFSSDN